MNKSSRSRVVGIREAKAHLSEYIKKSRDVPIVITSHGKPEAVLFNVSDQDPEDVILFTSPEFQTALAYQESKLIGSAELLKKYNSPAARQKSPSAKSKKTRVNGR